MEKSRLLLTGASGFLGTNIYPHLSKIYNINTVGLSKTNTYIVDLSESMPVFKEQYNTILHIAGKAHTVPKNEKEKQLFFDVNVQGTKNLCAGLEKVGIPTSFIFVSTVAVYGVDLGENITEEHPLNGNTPYALSKIQAEYFLQDWCSKNNVTLGIVRPSLIAGMNPPGNLGKMIKGINSGYYLRIGDGKAKKSVLMAEDIARIIPRLAEKGGVYNVCDNQHPTFSELEIMISSQLKKERPLSIPYWVAKVLALIGDRLGDRFPLNSSKLGKILNSLTFSNEKAKRELNWQPMTVLKDFKVNNYLS